MELPDQVGVLGLLAALCQGREKTDPGARALGDPAGSREFGHRGGDVLEREHVLAGPKFVHSDAPLQIDSDAQAALEDTALAAEQRTDRLEEGRVDATDVVCGAVVRSEQHQGVVGQAQLLQEIHELAYVLIEVADRRGVPASAKHRQTPSWTQRPRDPVREAG